MSSKNYPSLPILATLPHYRSQEAPTLADVPKLVDQMVSWHGEKSVAATYQLYRMSEYSHRHNRVPMLAMAVQRQQEILALQQQPQPRPQQHQTTAQHAQLQQPNLPPLPPEQQSLLTGLAHVLKRDGNSIGWEGWHYACLVLNNLSIPVENKAILAGGACPDILDAMSCVFWDAKSCMQQYNMTPCSGNRRRRTSHDRSSVVVAEHAAHVCCIYLLNLSLSDEVVQSGGLLIRGFVDFVGRARNFDGDNVLRINTDSSRWASRFLQSLTRSEPGAAMVGQTHLGGTMISHLHDTPWLPSCWALDSVESASLSVLLHLATWPANHNTLCVQCKMMDTIRPIVWESNVQGLKAIMIAALIGAPWTVTCPDGGQRASSAMEELLTNLVEGQGKEGQYDYHTFKLSTAAKAYRDLAKAAALPVSDKHKEQHMSNLQVLAKPAALASCLQILRDSMALSVTISDHIDSDKGIGRPDTVQSAPFSSYAATCKDYATAADYAVEALHTLLPALLLLRLPPTASTTAAPFPDTAHSGQVIVGTSAICQTLRAYATLAITNPKARQLAAAIVHELDRLVDSKSPWSPGWQALAQLTVRRPHRTAIDVQARIRSTPRPNYNVEVDRMGQVEQT